VDEDIAHATSFPPRLRDSVQPPVFDVRLLARVGVNARPVAAEEGAGGLRGPLVYNDLPGAVEAYRDERVYAASRVDIRWLTRVVNQYIGVFGPAEQDRTGEIAADMGQSARRWFTLSQASRFDGTSYRAYLESTAGESRTLATILQLESLLGSMRRLGLTPTEFRLARARLLQPILPEGVAPEDFAQAVEEAARRGS
jgi:hypothetical protein